MAATTTLQPPHSQLHPAHPAPPHSPTSEGTSRPDVANPLVDVSMLKVLAQRGLVDALNSVNGAKTLVLDPSLAGPLSLVTEVSLLKHHGVDKMFWLEPGPLNAATTHVVYLCRPQIKWMKIVADQIKRLTAGSTTHTYTLILVPRRTSLCDRILEEEGVLGEVNISSYKLELIAIEDDVVSLELENVWREINVDGDDTSIFYAAQALVTIQHAYGLFPRILGKGDGAKKLADLLIRSIPPPSSRTPATLSHTSEVIDSLIIIDRHVDMITPMLTQLTYEGLIDEFFDIQNSHVKVDPALLAPPPAGSASPGTSATPLPTGLPTSTPSQSKRSHHLHSADHLFAQLRGSNFAIVGGKLHKEARRLEVEYKRHHQAQTVSQLRDFVGKLGGLQNEHQALRLHTGLSEEISTRTRTEQFNKSLEIQQNLLQGYDTTSQITGIEDLVAQQAPIQIVLRLLCLANLVTGGIKVRVLENLKREILQTYGYSYVPMLLSLSSLSLLTSLPISKHSKIPSPPAFAPIRKSFRLLSDTLEAAPKDISYVYSGYAPLSVRLVQCVAQKSAILSPAASDNNGRDDKDDAPPNANANSDPPSPLPLPLAHPITGWKGFEDMLKLLPGEVVDRTQHSEGRADTKPAPHQDRPMTTMVFFLGGCTFTEIAALRWMGTQMQGRSFLVGTTGMVNGSSLLQSLGDGPSVAFGPMT
ncbi:hypothetical protein BS47DRAFT_1376541 [Hydnum rufescens UP504]|uniref:ATP binding protein n=1 Tax=Hydnum rufescens UP504 TaxID=1448309 RepID=A0A9P6DUH9_9AGAM|nr:hypothetical protein BS47DRAFT_1376541 [Hydnum rufescens UP504]